MSIKTDKDANDGNKYFETDIYDNTVHNTRSSCALHDIAEKIYSLHNLF